MSSRAVRLAAIIFALSASPLPAQPPAASGIARDAGLGTPLACLHVALIDSAEKAVAHTVTDAAGTFVLVAPRAGVYRVAFELLGWERLLGPADSLRDGEMRERVYPLAFADAPGPDGLPAAELRRGEGAGWRSAVAATPGERVQLIRVRGSGVRSPPRVLQRLPRSSSGCGSPRCASWRRALYSTPP